MIDKDVFVAASDTLLKRIAKRFNLLNSEDISRSELEDMCSTLLEKYSIRQLLKASEL